jgi:LmbE family N-acetylglucosaminyl deacetylase
MSRKRVSGLPRTLYVRSRDLRRDRAERRFRPRLRFDAGSPELLLSPHLDDAVLDCWSVLSDGRPLNVVNMFAGVPAAGTSTLWDAITGARDGAERMHERIAEDATALSLAGREPINLGLLDAQYRKPPPPLRLEDIDLAVAGAVASASRVYATAGIGSHPDHLLARRYARALLRCGMPVTLYAELPYCVFHGWPDWVDGREPDPNRDVDPFWRQALAEVPELSDLRSAHVERLDAQSAREKLAAMRSYRTQYPALNYGGHELLADPAIHGYEVRWDLRTPGGADERGTHAGALAEVSG